MARVLVIGGTLFIGRRLVERLLERGDEVVIMHRGKGTPFGKRVAEIICDRNDTAKLAQALSGERFDVVYDNVYDWQRGTTGEQVAAAAVAAAHGLQRYVFTSSVAVYPPGGEYDETASLVRSDDENAYGAQKADSERALVELQRRRNIPVTTLRPAFIYGPHNPFDRESFFWDRIHDERPIIIPDDGSRTLQWVHVDDVAAAAIVAANNDAAIGHAYNLASYPPISQNDFVTLLANIAGKRANPVHVPRNLIEKMGGNAYGPPMYFGVYLDIPPITVRNERVQSELGFELRSLEDGMRETYEWYLQQKRPKPDYTWEDNLIARAG
jgi:2'-hydroxyisoflavone reductase